MKQLLSTITILLLTLTVSAQTLSIKTSLDTWYVDGTHLTSENGFDSTFTNLTLMAQFLYKKTQRQNKLVNWYILEKVLDTNTLLKSKHRDPIDIEMTNIETNHTFYVTTNNIDSVEIEGVKIYHHWYTRPPE